MNIEIIYSRYNKDVSISSLNKSMSWSMKLQTSNFSSDSTYPFSTGNFV